MKTYTKDVALIRATADESFVVCLFSQSGGGYTWKLLQASDLLVVVSREVKPSAEVGGMAAIEFTFHAMHPGETTLVFHYGRSWENEPLETCRIPVAVTS